MARAMFKGTLRLDDYSIPVKLYAAVEDRRVHFRLLHAADKVPIAGRMVHPETGEEVPRDEVLRGYPTDDGIVVLRDEELESLKPESSRDIDVLRFVEPSRLNHPWYVRPYYLGPDGSSGDYFAFARALGQANKEGIVRWVMRNKTYRGALRAQGDYLVLISLRHADELIDASALPAPKGRAFSEQERKMAVQLISMLEGELGIEEFTDDYRDRVLSLVSAKARNEKVELPKAKTKRETESLLDALSASVQHAKEKKVA